MANPNWIKGQSGNPAGKPKGIKNKETLLREERRAMFDAEISKRWLNVIEQLPPTYIADQFLGKAPDKVEHSGLLKTNSDIDIELLAERMAKELKDKKI